MGLAIIVPNISFADANLGKVTVSESLGSDLQSIQIVCNDMITGSTRAAMLSVSYTPTNTNQRGISWEIISGSEYAYIDQQGYLNILPNANNNAIQVKATSTKNSTIYALKNLTVSYKNEGDEYIYFMPLTSNGKDAVKNISPSSEVNVTYSSDGAYFTGGAHGGIFYDNLEIIKSVVFEFKEYANSQTYMQFILSVDGPNTGNGLPNNDSYVMSLAALNNGQLQVTLKNGSNVLLDGNINAVAEIGSWHKVAIVTNKSNYVKYYLDGQLVHTHSSAQKAEMAYNKLAIGSNNTTNNTRIRTFSGNVRNLYCYDKELTESEAKEMTEI